MCRYMLVKAASKGDAVKEERKKLDRGEVDSCSGAYAINIHAHIIKPADFTCILS